MPDTKIRGLAELDKVLSDLPVKMEANILRGALRAGAMVIQQAAQANVPTRTGRLRDTIRASAGIDKRVGRVTARVRAGGRKTKRSEGAFYAHMVEFGTQPHDIKPRGRKSMVVAGLLREIVHHPGAAARPFMRPAMDASHAAAAQAVADYIRNRLTKQGIDVPDPTPDDLEQDE